MNLDTQTGNVMTPQETLSYLKGLKEGLSVKEALEILTVKK